MQQQLEAPNADPSEGKKLVHVHQIGVPRKHKIAKLGYKQKEVSE